SLPPHPPCTLTLSLHDALPIFGAGRVLVVDAEDVPPARPEGVGAVAVPVTDDDVRTVTREGVVDVGDRAPAVVEVDVAGHRLGRSEEHTSELQSRENLVCRLLL